MNIENTDLKSLIEKALDMRNYSYVPYSHFHVGVALLAKNGKVYGGCNIENASYTPTNCAERTAVFKAVSEGEQKFSAIAIVCSGKNPAAPCGVCRQVLREFCNSDMPVVFADAKRNYIESTLGELLPHSFGPEDLL